MVFLIGLGLVAFAIVFSSFFGRLPVAAATFASISFLACLLVFSFIVGPFTRRRLLVFFLGLLALVFAKVYFAFQTSFSYLGSCHEAVGQCTLSSRNLYSWWTILVLAFAGLSALSTSIFLLFDVESSPSGRRFFRLPYAIRLSLLVLSMLVIAVLCVFSNPFVSLTSVLFYPLELLMTVSLFGEERKGFTWFKFFLIAAVVIVWVGSSLSSISWLFPLSVPGVVSPEYYLSNPEAFRLIAAIFVLGLIPASSLSLLIFGLVRTFKKNEKSSHEQKSE